MQALESIAAIIGVAAAALAACYALVTAIAVLRWPGGRTAAPAPPSDLPPVSVLKPLCGAEPGLYEHLRSFCLQDFPQFQLVFGVRDSTDPALAVVKRLMAEFPQLPIDLSVNAQLHGSNYKISNLINMVAHARHPVLVLADSDISVGPAYLKAVTAPLQEHGVGLVTCLARGVPAAGLWSRLGAMYINEWYLPSVLLALLFGYKGFASGQTLCLRRDTLDAIGGLQAVADHLADDYVIGERVRALGQRIVLSPHRIDAQHDEHSLGRLVQHELRWMRTTRVLRPLSSCFLFFSFSLPLSALGVCLAATQEKTAAWAWPLFGVAAAARLVLHFSQRRDAGRRLPRDLWLLPLRDLLTCWIWCRSFWSYRVIWRGNEFQVGADGVMRSVAEQQPHAASASAR